MSEAAYTAGGRKLAANRTCGVQDVAFHWATGIFLDLSGK